MPERHTDAHRHSYPYYAVVHEHSHEHDHSHTRAEFDAIPCRIADFNFHSSGYKYRDSDERPIFDSHGYLVTSSSAEPAAPTSRWGDSITG